MQKVRRFLSKQAPNTDSTLWNSEIVLLTTRWQALQKRGQSIDDPKALASLNDSTFSEDANQVGDAAVFWIRAVPCLRQRQCRMQMIGLFEVGLMRGRDLGKCFKSWVCRFLIIRSRGRRPRRGLRQPATSPKEGRRISMLQVGHLSQLGWGRTSFYIMQDVQQGWRRVNIQYFDIKVGGETCLNRPTRHGTLKNGATFCEFPYF